MSGSAGVGKRLTAVQSAYTRLWSAFRDASNSENLGADATDGKGAVVSQKDGTTTATAELFLKGWPYKVASTKSVDIAVKVTEVFSSALDRVTKATTCVGYFRRNSEAETSHALLELHYDFETPVPEAHPMFHAQIGSTNWPEDRLQKLGMVGKIERPVGMAAYGKARIPTAFMGYAPILVVLAADHLSARGFRSVIKAVRGDKERVDPECELLAASLLPGGIPHAHHWYDERYLVHEWTEASLYRAEVPLLGETFSSRDAQTLRAQIAKKLGVPMKQLQFVKGKPQAGQG